MGSSISKPAVEAVDSEYEKFGLATDFASLGITGSKVGFGARANNKPASPEGSLTISQLEDWEEKVKSDAKLQLTRTVLNNSSIPDALTKAAVAISDPHVFNLALDFQTDPITNQLSSGRCWLFATTNVLRYSIMKKLNLDGFQLSQVQKMSFPWEILTKDAHQSYLFIYDKLEKSNYFLEMSIKHADLPIDDRRVNHANNDLISDGGQWDMACNLLKVKELLNLWEILLFE